MPNRKDYPSNFYASSKPVFRLNKPVKVNNTPVLQDTKSLSDGDVVFETDTTITYISIGYDYGYYSDEKIAEVSLKTYTKGDKENPNYDKELAAYNRKLAAHNKQLEEWDRYKKKWDEESALEKEANERQIYETLKAKFEGKE